MGNSGTELPSWGFVINLTSFLSLTVVNSSKFTLANNAVKLNGYLLKAPQDIFLSNHTLLFVIKIFIISILLWLSCFPHNLRVKHINAHCKNITVISYSPTPWMNRHHAWRTMWTTLHCSCVTNRGSIRPYVLTQCSCDFPVCAVMIRSCPRNQKKCLILGIMLVSLSHSMQSLRRGPIS